MAPETAYLRAVRPLSWLMIIGGVLFGVYAGFLEITSPFPFVRSASANRLVLGSVALAMIATGVGLLLRRRAAWYALLAYCGFFAMIPLLRLVDDHPVDPAAASSAAHYVFNSLFISAVGAAICYFTRPAFRKDEPGAVLADSGGIGMEVKLKPDIPAYRRRLRAGVNHWAVAAVIGLLGTWISGTTVQVAGDFWNHQMSIVVTPMTGILTLVWIGVIAWWYTRRASLDSKYRAAISGHSDFLCLDDYGVTWGVEDVASTRIAWSAVAFSRIRSGQVELGLPAGVLKVDLRELEGDVGDQELEAFLRSKGVRTLR